MTETKQWGLTAYERSIATEERIFRTLGVSALPGWIKTALRLDDQVKALLTRAEAAEARAREAEAWMAKRSEAIHRAFKILDAEMDNELPKPSPTPTVCAKCGEPRFAFAAGSQHVDDATPADAYPGQGRCQRKGEKAEPSPFETFARDVGFSPFDGPMAEDIQRTCVGCGQTHKWRFRPEPAGKALVIEHWDFAASAWRPCPGKPAEGPLDEEIESVKRLLGVTDVYRGIPPKERKPDIPAAVEWANKFLRAHQPDEWGSPKRLSCSCGHSDPGHVNAEDNAARTILHLAPLQEENNRLREALEKIESYTPSIEDIAKMRRDVPVENCPACRDAYNRKWPPSGLCDEHYSRFMTIEREEESRFNTQHVEMRRIARAALHPQPEAKEAR